MRTHRLGVQAMSAQRSWDARPMLRGVVRDAMRPLQPVGVGQEVARGLIATPGTIAARIAELNNAIDAFMLDVTAHRVQPAQEALYTQWKAQVATWVQTWRAFKDEAGWFERLSGETDTRVDSYWQRFCTLVNDYTTRFGGQLTLARPPQCTPAPKSEFWHSVRVGLTVSVGAALLLYLVRNVFAPRPQAVILSAPPQGEA